MLCRGTEKGLGAFPSLEELGWIQRTMKGHFFPTPTAAPKQPGDLGSQGQDQLDLLTEASRAWGAVLFTCMFSTLTHKFRVTSPLLH